MESYTNGFAKCTGTQVSVAILSGIVIAHWAMMPSEENYRELFDEALQESLNDIPAYDMGRGHKDSRFPRRTSVT